MDTPEFGPNAMDEIDAEGGKFEGQELQAGERPAGEFGPDAMAEIDESIKKMGEEEAGEEKMAA